MKYRAVIFDLWQTLVPWDQEQANRFYDRMADAAGIDQERFREAWLSGRKSREIGPIADHLQELRKGSTIDAEKLTAALNEYAAAAKAPPAEAPAAVPAEAPAAPAGN